MRPIKSGVDYFPLDTAMNDSIELIEAEFGLKGFAIVIKLWQKIYGGFGYYCKWNREIELLFKKANCLSDNSVSEIISACLRRGIFDKDMYEKYGILTSRGIQSRYFEAAKRREKLNVEKRFLLVQAPPNAVYADKNGENVNINQKNVNESTQRKEEKNKGKEEKESKEFIPAEPCDIPFDEIIHSFNSICTFLPPAEDTQQSRRSIKAVYGEVINRGGFGALFTLVKNSDFLSGRNGMWKGCTFEWIMKSANVRKIFDRKYETGTVKEPPNRQPSYNPEAFKPKPRQPSYDLEAFKAKARQPLVYEKAHP